MMQDDYAPRPKCRCVAERVVTVVSCSLLVVTAALAWSLSRELTKSEAALSTANLTIAKHEQHIDQQARIIQAWVDEHPPTDGELEPGAMGARIIPTIRHSAEEANGAIIEMRDLGKRASKVFDDIEAGRTGFHIKFSVMKGEADVTLRKQP